MTEAEAPQAGTRGPTVLLVEDERVDRRAVRQRARSERGFRTIVARHGRARRCCWLRELAPDVVLLDLALPDADGRDVCRRIRRESDVPIIMVTASGTVTDRVVGLELGADDYVVKPFAVGEVIARIRAVLRRGRGRRRSTARPSSTSQDLRIDRARAGPGVAGASSS